MLNVDLKKSIVRKIHDSSGFLKTALLTEHPSWLKTVHCKPVSMGFFLMCTLIFRRYDQIIFDQYYEYSQYKRTGQRNSVICKRSIP
jgi:hypothetical protein